MYYLLSFVILLSSCTSLQTQSLLVKFNQAVSENQKGNGEKANELWSQLCLKKHKASCLLAGKETSWYPGLSIMQGASDESSAQFSILYKKSDAHKIFVFDKKTMKMRKKIVSFLIFFFVRRLFFKTFNIFLLIYNRNCADS